MDHMDGLHMRYLGGRIITFPADGEVLHHTLSVVVHHLSQLVHGRDSVVPDTRQHYACAD